MKSLAVINSFEAPDLCTPCGGRCCKHAPGLAMPNEFGDTKEEIKNEVRRILKSGQWSIDNWEGDPRPDGELYIVYYVRPKMIHETFILNNSWYGACVFHSPAIGCMIFENRPSECRGLKPGKDRCKSEHSTKKDCVIAWIPYQEMLEELLIEFGELKLQEIEE